MTEILTGPGSNFPQHKKRLPPMPAKPRAGSVSQLKSLNQGVRDKNLAKITYENEMLLKRLQ
jgi:hypothetical protein